MTKYLAMDLNKSKTHYIDQILHIPFFIKS